MPRVPVELRALVRRRRLGRWLFYAALCLIGLSVFCEHLGCFGWEGSDHARFDAKRFVIEAVTRDGTLYLGAKSVRVEVRLLGLVDGGVDPRACAQYLGTSVIVKLERLQTRDLRGRLLAYLYLDERTVLNVELARQGAAHADRNYPNTLRAAIEGAEYDAKRHKRGLWHK